MTDYKKIEIILLINVICIKSFCIIMVLTRSQTKLMKSEPKVLEIDINFDYASLCWNANKKKIGMGSYKYICGHVLKNGNRCSRPPNCRIHK